MSALACWLVRHGTMGCLSHWLSVWYFCLQVLLYWSSSVGCGGNSACVPLLDSVCCAVKGMICHALWTPFPVHLKVKFHKLQWLCYAVSGKCPYTELCFLCSQRISVKLNCWPGFSHAVFAVCRGLKVWVRCAGKTMITAEISVFVNQVNSLCPVVGQS